MFRYGIIALFVLSFQFTMAQTIFNMSNSLVTDCEGTLLDSEAGPGGTTYGNNENFKFKICSGGKITMNFVSPFCVDSGFDWLRVYDGPDTNSILLGTFTGYSTPSTVVANSGCMTIHFSSDAITAYCGWEARWTTDKIPPIPPTMSIDPVPACSTNSIRVQFSKYIPCDSLLAGDFTVTGPVSNIVVNSLTSSGNCSSPGDTTNTLTLHLNKNLNQNCDYVVEMDLGLPDNCDSIWYFYLVDTFRINDCSYNVTIEMDPDTICPGMCTDITALISGNGPSCLTYNYTWNQGLPNSAGPHTVCISNPSSFNITYTVSVQAVGGGPVVNASRTLVFVNPTLVSGDTTVCQSDPPFNLQSANGGGRYTGPGITNSTTGLFDPDSAGPGNHSIKYGFTNFCEDSIMITVKPLDAGLDQAACPGTSPFMVSVFSPSGGVWSGDSITPSGVFNPAVSGVYTLTYSFNGCSESKTITVDSIVLNTPVDTVCESDTAFNISVSPPGGRWYGTGITDSLTGRFDPQTAGPGQKALTYKLSGCDFNIVVMVNEIDAGNNITVCPADPSFTINPAGQPSGGMWSGNGILNPNTGLYDPGTAFGGNQGNDNLTYTHPNGCSDEKIIYVRNTRIDSDTLTFCVSDTALELDFTNVGRSPGGGSWSGNGLTNSGSRYFFHPSLAGTGVHFLYYTRTNCYDSIAMIVYPDIIKNFPLNQSYPDTTVCTTHPDWNLPPMPPGGKWVGQGIVNSKTGLFSPSAAGPGSWILKYETPNGCPDDSVVATIYQFVRAQILGLDSNYCYRDTFIPYQLKPKWGKITGPGIDSSWHFNPALAGPGTHTLHYTYGNGLCKTDTTLKITISPPIKAMLVASDQKLCPGESSTITVTGSGGTETANFTYKWNEDLFSVNQHTVTPGKSTWYVVKTSDGCSDPVTDSILIEVVNDVDIDFETSDPLCYGVDGFARAIYADSLNYEIIWHGNPEQMGDEIEGPAGANYRVTVTDKNTGCTLDTSVKIPSYKNIVANFTTSPNYECIPTDQKTVTFLDLSHNADSGFWDIAGTIVEYELGKNPSYAFTDAGYYNVTLTVFNRGGCTDSHSAELCVQDIRPVFVADAFTPNGDGINDVLHVKTQGVKELNFRIYDRWGNLVFESNHVDDGWDGTIRGRNANPGVYIYVVQSKNINNERGTQQGNVTLVR